MPDTQDKRLRLEMTHRRAVILLAVLGVFTVLKIGMPIFMPLGVAIFLIALAQPVKVWLNRYLPESVSYVGTICALGATMTLAVCAVWFSAAEIAATAPQYKVDVQNILYHARRQLADNGVESANRLRLEDLRMLMGFLFSQFQEGLFYCIVIVAYVVLGLPEIGQWKGKVRSCLSKEAADKVLDTGEMLGKSFQTYLMASLLGGLIAGATTLIAAFMLHLDFAVTWGILAFVLNFIPTIGGVMLVVPATILATLQFDGTTMPLLVFSVFGATQLIIRLFVNTRLQGSMLSISTVVIIFSIMLWGYIWGLPGALLATPLTHAIMIACDHYDSTRWIARLLAERRPARPS